MTSKQLAFALMLAAKRMDGWDSDVEELRRRLDVALRMGRMALSKSYQERLTAMYETRRLILEETGIEPQQLSNELRQLADSIADSIARGDPVFRLITAPGF